MSKLEQEPHVTNNHSFISSAENPNYKILLYVPNAIGKGNKIWNNAAYSKFTFHFLLSDISFHFISKIY